MSSTSLFLSSSDFLAVLVRDTGGGICELDEDEHGETDMP